MGKFLFSSAWGYLCLVEWGRTTWNGKETSSVEKCTLTKESQEHTEYFLRALSLVASCLVFFQ